MLGYVSDFAVFQSFGTFFEFFIAIFLVALGYRLAMTLCVHDYWPLTVILIFVLIGIMNLIPYLSFYIGIESITGFLDYIYVLLGYFTGGFAFCSILYGFSML